MDDRTVYIYTQQITSPIKGMTPTTVAIVIYTGDSCPLTLSHIIKNTIDVYKRQCQEFPKEKWVDARREDILDAPYFLSLIHI